MAGRDLTFGVSFRHRGMAAAGRGVRAVSRAIRSTGTVSRKAAGGVVGLTGALGSATRRIIGYGEALRRTAVHTEVANRSAQRYRRTASSLVASGVMRGAGRLGVTALAGMGVLRNAGQAAREAIDLNARLVRLMTDARGDEHWMSDVWDDALDASRKYGVKISGVLDGVHRIIGDTGDKAFAAAAVDPIARVMQAWGASGNDLGTLAAQVQKFGIDVQTGLELAAASGVRGSIPLPALASVAGPLFGEVGGLGGWGGEEGYSQILAMAQSVASVKGGAEGVNEAVTAVRAFTSSFLRAEVRKKMEERGITVYENGRLRLPFDVIADLGEWSDGDMRRLGEIFTDLEQLTALVPMMRPGGQEQMRSFVVGSDAARAETDHSLFKNMETTRANLERMSAEIDAVVKDLDTYFLGPLSDLTADALPGVVAYLTEAVRLFGQDLYWIFTRPAALVESLKSLWRHIKTGGVDEAPLYGVDSRRRSNYADPSRGVVLAIAGRDMQAAATRLDSGAMTARLGPSAAGRLAGRLPAFADTGALEMLAPPPAASISATPPPARPATSVAGVDIPPEVLAAIPPGGHVVIHRGGDIGEMNFTINAPSAEAEDIADAVRGGAEELLAVVDRERGVATAQHD